MINIIYKIIQVDSIVMQQYEFKANPTQILKTWSVFKTRRFDFVHLNINNLSSKTEEI